MAALGLSWQAITHLAISHFHPDHVGDIPLLLMAWRYGQLPARAEPVTILGPVGTLALLRGYAAALGDWILDPGFPLRVVELASGDQVTLRDATRIDVRKVPHTSESVAYSVTADGRRLVYTGDTAFDEELGRWAAGSDVLLAECSLPTSMALPNHLTPEECGELAEIASPERLVLTHFYPPVERVDIPALVARRYAGNVTLAADGWFMDFEER
jgi:ribonuclease BN (tRNA processing enzyme)